MNKGTEEKGEETEPAEIYCLEQNNEQKTVKRY